MKYQLIKYCPRCKKEVAVQKNGNRYGKQSYLCKECVGTKKRQFVDRKYPIEIRSLAVRFRDFGYSYRKIAKIFGIEKSPNTIRNWTLSENTYKTPDKTTITILKKYKEILEQIVESAQSEQEKLQKEINKLNRDLVKPNLPSGVFMRMIEQKQMLCAKQRKLGEIQSSYSIGKLKDFIINETNEKINEQEKIKIEAECVFARDTYDISEIISILEKITT